MYSVHIVISNRSNMLIYFKKNGQVNEEINYS